VFIEAPKALPSLYRIGSAGRGMNGERAPGSALSYVEGSALSYVEGVNRQIDGNLARRRQKWLKAISYWLLAVCFDD